MSRIYVVTIAKKEDVGSRVVAVCSTLEKAEEIVFSQASNLEQVRKGIGGWTEIPFTQYSDGSIDVVIEKHTLK